MFTLEVAGKGQRTSTFILPPGDKTYLVHCDVPQHMEKGMKAQLKAGAGDGDLPSIPGVTGPRLQDPYALALERMDTRGGRSVRVSSGCSSWGEDWASLPESPGRMPYPLS